MSSDELLLKHQHILTIFNDSNYDSNAVPFLKANYSTKQISLDEYEDIIENGEIDPGIPQYTCYLAAGYVAYLWSGKTHVEESNLDKIDWLDLLLPQYNNHVYYCELYIQNPEVHGFILWIDNDIIHYYSCFGGDKCVIYKEFDKTEFISINSNLCLHDLSRQKEILDWSYARNDNTFFYKRNYHKIMNTLSLVKVI